jgi:hypothetical protein
MSALLPYGGGGTLNEVDGNFTFRRDEYGLFLLHWLGKIRGLPFEPLHFRIDKLDSPDVVTVEGARLKMPVMFPITEEAVEERDESFARINLALLEAAPRAADRVKLVAPEALQRVRSQLFGGRRKWNHGAIASPAAPSGEPCPPAPPSMAPSLINDSIGPEMPTPPAPPLPEPPAPPAPPLIVPLLISVPIVPELAIPAPPAPPRVFSSVIGSTSRDNADESHRARATRHA